MLAIDLSAGDIDPGVHSETWGSADASEAVMDMIATIEPSGLARVAGQVSLRGLAELSDPTVVSDSLCDRLAQVRPEMVQKIGSWAKNKG